MLRYHLKLFAECRPSLDSQWQKVVCYVSFDHNRKYRQIVEDYFQYHLRLDIEYTKEHQNFLFSEPHNIATALAVYSYFRVNSLFFRLDTVDYISDQSLPRRPANVKNRSCKIWVEYVQPLKETPRSA